VKKLFPDLKLNKKSVLLECHGFSKNFPASAYGSLFAAAYHANMWKEAAEFKFNSLSGETRYLGFNSL